jgi:hypothetical protein
MQRLRLQRSERREPSLQPFAQHFSHRSETESLPRTTSEQASGGSASGGERAARSIGYNFGQIFDPNASSRSRGLASIIPGSYHCDHSPAFVSTGYATYICTNYKLGKSFIKSKFDGQVLLYNGLADSFCYKLMGGKVALLRIAMNIDSIGTCKDLKAAYTIMPIFYSLRHQLCRLRAHSANRSVQRPNFVNKISFQVASAKSLADLTW